MRSIIASALMMVSVSTPGAAFHGQSSGATSGTASDKACSILTKDLVLPLTQNPKLLDLIPPEEEPLANGGAACEFGPVRLQLYRPRSSPTKTQQKDFEAIQGVGDLAYFHNNRDRYAELMVWSGIRFFTLQVSVPSGSTAEATKPKTVALANQIIARLK